MREFADLATHKSIGLLVARRALEVSNIEIVGKQGALLSRPDGVVGAGQGKAWLPMPCYDTEARWRYPIAIMAHHSISVLDIRHLRSDFDIRRSRCVISDADWI